MDLSPGTAPKTFNLLSIGQRAVGKTVFLAGSYAELHFQGQPDSSQPLWFDCQDSQVQERIERLLSYMTQTGQYPPPTIKITDFNFSLKRRGLWGGAQTLCHFNWWDVPGEICNTNSPEFRRMVANSHGCCVFIDAFRLVNDPAYLPMLQEDVILQVKALADLILLNGLKYAFALILTKCDLLEESGSFDRQQIEESLRSLTTHLDTLGANYQIFYLAIPLVSAEGDTILGSSGAAAPLLWLVEELSQVYNLGLVSNSLRLITRLLPSRSQSRQSSADGLTRNLRNVTSKANVKKMLRPLELRLRSLPTVQRYYLILGLVLISSVGIIATLFVDYRWVYQRQPNNLDALTQAELENLKLRLQLAQSYGAMGQTAAAEVLYDEILAEQQNNLDALVGKAVLRSNQGDTEMAKALFAQAEKAAPADLKAQVRKVAQKTLQASAKSSPSVQ